MGVDPRTAGGEAVTRYLVDVYAVESPPEGLRRDDLVEATEDELVRDRDYQYQLQGNSLSEIAAKLSKQPTYTPDDVRKLVEAVQKYIALWPDGLPCPPEHSYGGLSIAGRVHDALKPFEGVKP